MGTRPKAGFYAVIPADVRYDEQIPPNAKLLYAEISALSNASGCCTAGDDWFLDNYGFSDRTVRRLLAALEEAGYVRTEVLRDPDTGQVTGREIYLGAAYAAKILNDLKVKNSAHASGQNCPEATGQNCPEYIKKNNIYNPPKPPQGGVCDEKKPKRRRGEYKQQADTLPERFEGFWKFYRGICPGTVNPGNRQDAIRAWDKLAPDSALVEKMGAALLRQSKSADWQRGMGVPHASTWLNKHMWEDDWGEAPKAAQEGTKQEEGDWL